MKNKMVEKIAGSSLKNRFAWILALQTILILLLWFHYHSVSLANINESTQHAAQLSAERLGREIRDELDYMRTVCSAIGGSDYVKDFLQEEDVLPYYEKAIVVSEIVDKIAFPIVSSDSVITINSRGEYYRFSGGVSNPSCERLYQIFGGAGVMYTVIELDGVNYFCHNSPVIVTADYKPVHIGNVIMLTDLSKTRRLLESDASSDVDMLVLADDVVLLASVPALEGKSKADLLSLYPQVMFTDIGNTGATIGTAIRGQAARMEQARFVAASVLVILLMLTAVFLIYAYLSNGMVRPMAQIFRDVHTIEDGNERLAPTGRRDFDALVGEINEMLDRTKRYHMGLLGKQINIHFILNTLLYIQGLTKSGENEKATLAAGELITLIRHMNLGETLVNIFVEMEFLESYIALMNIKHDNKFMIDYDVDDHLAEYRMPSFILQPVVENALTHGMGGKAQACSLSIVGQLTRETIVFIVKDNGAGIPQTRLKELRQQLSLAHQGEFTEASAHGVALCNIQRRLHVLFGDQYGIGISSEPGLGTTVTITLPPEKEI